MKTNQPETKTDSEIVENLVAEYYAKHQDSPFKNFEMKEDDQIAVDMDQEFEATLATAFGDETSSVLGEYISGLVKNLMENLSEDDIKALKEIQDAEDTEDTEDTEANEANETCESGECCKN